MVGNGLKENREYGDLSAINERALSSTWSTEGGLEGSTTGKWMWVHDQITGIGLFCYSVILLSCYEAGHLERWVFRSCDLWLLQYPIQLCLSTWWSF